MTLFVRMSSLLSSLCKGLVVSGVSGLWQRRFYLFQHPLVWCFQMAVVTVEPVVKNVLEQTRSLSAQNGISFHFLKVPVRRACGKDLDLPFTFRISGVTVRIDFRG